MFVDFGVMPRMIMVMGPMLSPVLVGMNVNISVVLVLVSVPVKVIVGVIMIPFHQEAGSSSRRALHPSRNNSVEDMV